MLESREELMPAGCRCGRGSCSADRPDRASVSLAADVATYASLRSFLVDRVDGTLDRPSRVEPPHLDDEHGRREAVSRPPARPGATRPAAAPTARSRRCRRPGFPGGDAPRRRSCPASRSTPVDGPATVRYFNAGRRGGSGHYRVRASFEPRPEHVLVVAQPLGRRRRTLHRLLLIEAARDRWPCSPRSRALGLWVVRLGLRPLGAIEPTAEAIADGDLSAGSSGPTRAPRSAGSGWP